MATYYVAKTGSDSNPGTQILPKLTITAGLGLLTAPGDILEIKGGVYVETLLMNAIASGTAAAQTTIKSFGTDDVIIRPSTFIAGNTSLVNFVARDYITLKGSPGHYLVVDGVNVPFPLDTHSSAIRGSATSGVSSCGNIIIEYVEVKNTPYHAVALHPYHALPQEHHCIIRHCWFHDNGAGAAEGWTSPYPHCVYMKGKDNIIEDCIIERQKGGLGIHLYSQDTASGEVDRNIIRRNRISNTAQTGILVGGGSDNMAYDNIVHDCGEPGGVGIRVAYGGANNSQVYNNTVYSCGAFIQILSGAVGTIVRNNIGYQNTTNTVSNGGTGTIQSNNLMANPSFVNAPADFHLQAGSAAINFGTNLSSIFTTDFDGVTRPASGAWEAGAYEFGGAPPDTTPPAVPTGLTVT
jgi:parallel beta-helix repeat protein